MENKTLRLYTRITPAEKKRIFSLAKRCGLSVSEYIRQRVLGFTPREIQPEIFYELVRRIEMLYREKGSEEDDEKSVEVDCPFHRVIYM